MIHTVKSGETIWGLSWEYGVSASRLRSDNGLQAGQPLVPGQALVILVPSETYTVRPGDTLNRIPGETGTTVVELVQNNPTLVDGTALEPGQVLAIRFPGVKKKTLTVNGYAYPYILPPMLRRALPFLTYLSVFSYGYRADGTLIEPQDAFLLAEAKRFGVGPVVVLTAIDETGNFNNEGSRAAPE